MPKVLKLFSKNKRTIFFIVGLGLVFSFLPYSFIEADPVIQGPEGSPLTPPGGYDLCEPCGPWPHEWPHCFACIIGYLASFPVRLAFAGLVIPIFVFALVFGLIYAGIAALLDWLLGTIMSVGIVPGAINTPEIVSIGWNFSRQFANLFFILALAFIGLATILRIKEYEMKKALPTLIIIALLINFTPVIVGFVVDMGNIVTKFFLNSVGSVQGFWDIISSVLNYFVYSMAHIFLRDGAWWQNLFGILGEAIGIIIYGFVLLTFFVLAGFVYLLVGAVFFCRTVILWILMIISPIAFLSKVFPAGRTTKMVFPDILHWDKWWQSLIQWTIIGIPISFFLYLSNLIMLSKTSVSGIFNLPAMEQGVRDVSDYASSTVLVPLGDQFTSLITSLLAPTIALVFLVIGMLISFKAVPEGAQGIMRLTTEKGAKRGWQSIRAGLSSIGRAPQRYRAAHLREGMGGWQAVRHTIRHTFSDTGRQMLGAWRQRKTPVPTAPTDTTEAPDSTTAEDRIITPASTTSMGHEEESLIGEERLERRQRLARGEEVEPLPSTGGPAPATGGRRARAARAARWWFNPTPRGAGRAAFRFGGRIAAKILKDTESMAIQEIEKRMKIDKESKEGKARGGKTKDTINCPICLKEIPRDSKFCPYCREELL